MLPSDTLRGMQVSSGALKLNSVLVPSSESNMLHAHSKRSWPMKLFTSIGKVELASKHFLVNSGHLAAEHQGWHYMLQWGWNMSKITRLWSVLVHSALKGHMHSCRRRSHESLNRAFQLCFKSTTILYQFCQIKSWKRKPLGHEPECILALR